MVKAHKLAHVFDFVRTVCINLFLEKYIVQRTSSVCDTNYANFFSDSYFVKVPILYFLVIHFVAIKCFLFLFFPSQECIFSFEDFCLVRVTALFLLFFKYLLIICCQTSKQTNKQMKTSGKNNLCVTIEWKLFCLCCDAKECKHYTFPFKIYKRLVKESRGLHTKCDWPQSAVCFRQS